MKNLQHKHNSVYDYWCPCDASNKTHSTLFMSIKGEWPEV